MSKKKIIIIGAGISGLTAGIYGLDNDFDVTIYEKHNIVGGQCTGWVRDGVFIDGCAHWIVGTNPKSDLYHLWRHVGAFDENSHVYDTEYFCKYDINGEVVTLYSDLKKLEEELLRISPEDKKQIRHFINGIKAYQHVAVPVNKPMDFMNIFDYIEMGIKMLPMVRRYIIYRKTSAKEYGAKFKSPSIRELIERTISPRYNVHSLFYIMQTLSTNDAGVIEGGSMKIALNIKKNFTQKGGKVYTNKEIDHILVKDNKAIGVVFKDGNIDYADYVVSTTDLHHTLYDLLENKYYDKKHYEKFENQEAYPLNEGILISFKVNKDVSNLPKMFDFVTDGYDFFGNKIRNITIRNHAFDKTICKNGTPFTILLDAHDKTYDMLAALDKETYYHEKEKLGNFIKKEIMKKLSLKDDEISLLDIATPLTYNRYTNAYKGSYMSFLTTEKAKGLITKGTVKGVSNLFLAGQWLMPPGGLPIALFTGKHVIYRICRADKKKFLSLDMCYKKMSPNLSTQ